MAVALVRYGAVPEVARFLLPEGMTLERGDCVVIDSSRGPMLGSVLEIARPAREPGQQLPDPEAAILRLAAPEDLAAAEEHRSRAMAGFSDWERRIADWHLDLQLVEVEFTLDGAKQILYVLNERGPDCTKLAIQAAAAGLGIIEVQPITATGLVTQPTLKVSGGGGCGSGGCGCH